jgi:hypothetical protein
MSSQLLLAVAVLSLGYSACANEVGSDLELAAVEADLRVNGTYAEYDGLQGKVA